ncbi:MAG: hypothetical protein IJE90_00630 [Clostridia bacterium]|nr:hypothetical protein [Clostridia bacterium]
MKKAYLLLTVLLAAALLFTACSEDAAENKNEVISGMYFGTSVKAMASSSDADSSLELVSLTFDGSKVRFSGNASYPDGKIELNLEGTVYKSIITDTTMVYVFEDEENFSLASFVIETVPDAVSMQKLTKQTINDLPEDKKNLPVIKIALKLENGEVVYYEDVLETVSVTDGLNNAKIAPDNDTENILYANERWFMFFDTAASADSKDAADTNSNKDTNGAPVDTPPVDTTPVDTTPEAEIVCEFDTVTFKHTNETVIMDGATAGGELEIEYQYTFYYDWETDSFVDEIYKLLKQFDEVVQPKDGEADFSNSAHFYLRDGEGEEVIEFDYPSGGNAYGSKRIWVKTSATQRRALTVEATERFIELCSNKGLTADNFFKVSPHRSMIDWAISFRTDAPILLYDANRELTAQQAAEKMLYDFGEQLTQPAIDRYFHYENYSGWEFELYSNKTEDESIKELYHTDTLTDDQYVVDWGQIRGDLVGIDEISFGGYVERYFLEYEAGIWRLWLRDRP